MSDRDPDALDAVTNEDRFTVELEFVQSLANPRYVHFLASKGVLRDDRFIAYLRYLRYWERPEYAKFILYPNCLRFRRLLLDDAFRVAMENPRNAERAFKAQFERWSARGAAPSRADADANA